jgi:autotransporter-associated beta strand protein
MKSGSGVLTINGTNTFSGSVTITQGIVRVGSAGAGNATSIGAAGSSLIIAGGTLDLSPSSITNLNGTKIVTKSLVAIAGAGANGQGAIVNNGPQGGYETNTSLIGFAPIPFILTADATIGGQKRWDIWHPATLDLAGHTLTKVGPCEFWSWQSITSGKVVIAGGLFGFPNGMSMSAGSISITPGGKMQLYHYGGAFALPISVDNGTLVGRVSTYNSSIVISNTCWIENRGTPDILQFNGVISGAGSIVKQDIGPVVFAAKNTYSGSTTVSTGTLFITGSISTGLVMVSTGAVLGGTGTINGPLLSDGTVAPAGSSFGFGKLTVSNDFSQTTNGTLSIELGGGPSSFGVLSISGKANLNGSIRLTRVEIFEPYLGASFVVLKAGSVTGRFAVANLPALSDPNLCWQVIYSPSNVMLSVALTGYGQWASGITNGLTSVTDSATGDGYANLLKYATGSSPTNSDSLAAMNGDTSTGLFALRFNRNTNASDITLIAEGSDGATNNATWKGIATNILGSWGGATNVIESGTGTPVSVSVQDTATPLSGAATNRFLRLRVTRP